MFLMLLAPRYLRVPLFTLFPITHLANAFADIGYDVLGSRLGWSRL